VKTALDAAKAYLAKLPPAISGAGGHAATFAAACWTVRLGLSDSDALALLLEYNRRCLPPWTEKELAHKLHDARRVAGGQARTFEQPRPAQRIVWKLAHKPARVASASLPPDCQPWLHVAQQVLAGEFDAASRSLTQSLCLGLEDIAHPLCRRAFARLKTRLAKL